MKKSITVSLAVVLVLSFGLIHWWMKTEHPSQRESAAGRAGSATVASTNSAPAPTAGTEPAMPPITRTSNAPTQPAPGPNQEETVAAEQTQAAPVPAVASQDVNRGMALIPAGSFTMGGLAGWRAGCDSHQREGVGVLHGHESGELYSMAVGL
jgi:hypothetical protein